MEVDKINLRSSLELPDVMLGNKIPHVIHQTFSKADLPPLLRANVEALKSKNPGWRHIFYDNGARERFISAHYGPDLLAAYRRIRPEYGAARADLFRYLAIYAVGGVYLDLKSSVARPLSSLLQADDRLILSQWRNGPGQFHQGIGLHKELAHIPGGEFQMFHVIAVPGHPFLKAVIQRVLYNIEHYRAWRHGVGAIGVVRLSGPIAYTLAIAPLLEDGLYRRVENETVLSLVASVIGGRRDLEGLSPHYSQLMHAIVDPPLWARPASTLYALAKRVRAQLHSSMTGRS